MSANGISTLPTKEARQIAKLNLAAAKRGEPYDINLLPTKYDNNSVINNPNPGGLQKHRPWIPSGIVYSLAFRSDTGSGPGSIITSCNEGDVIWFSINGFNIPPGEAYVQFSGANITPGDGQFPFEVGLLDQLLLPPDGGNYPIDYFSAPLLITADNLTEGNETLTLTWYINGSPVASTSVSIVDTSVTPTSYTFVGYQSATNGGSNGVHIDSNPTTDAWASTVPIGATIVADGIGTFTVTGIYTPTDPGNFSANWFFVVTPGTSNFPAGTMMTFSWTV